MLAFASASGSTALESQDGVGRTLLLAGLFGLWYLFNIYFNIFNKQVLKVYPYPLTETVVQFAVGSVIALLCWALRVVRLPKISFDQMKNQILVVGLVHTMGNAFTNLSLGAVAVSFTHTIKAMEPFFSVLLSWAFLKEVAPLPVLLSLVPIVGGVALASASEASFNWMGFGTAMASNVTFQSRNVLSKKFMTAKTGPQLDNVNIFSLMTLVSFCLLLPVAVAVEGFHFYPSAMRAMGIADPHALIKKALMAGVFFHLYQQVSYMILQRVSPVTHSIGNCVKRVVIIITSVLVFQNPMGSQNMAGTALALGGVFFYSQMKQHYGKKKVA